MPIPFAALFGTMALALSAAEPAEPGVFDWLTRMREGGTSYLSLAVASDRVALGGPSGVVELAATDGAVMRRWPEPVDRIWFDDHGVLWALPTSELHDQLLRWQTGSSDPPELVPLDDAVGSIWSAGQEADGESRGALPESLRGACGPAVDGAGTHWVVTTKAPTIWRDTGSGWTPGEPLPVELGAPLELRGATQAGAWVLGTSGLARIDHTGRPELVHHETIRESLPRGVLLMLGLFPALALAALVGGAALLAHWWRGVKRWSLLDAVLALALFSGGQVVIAAAAWASGFQLVSAPVVAASFGSGALLATGYLLLRLRAQRLDWAAIGLVRPAWRLDLLWGFVAAAVAWFTLPFAVWVCTRLGLPRMLYEQSFQQLLNPTGAIDVALFAFTIAVLAPLVEEVLFRGYLLRALSERFGAGLALSASALVFGLAHGEGILLTGLLGGWFAWIALRRRTLWPTIIAHALINAVSLVVLLAGLE